MKVREMFRGVGKLCNSVKKKPIPIKSYRGLYILKLHLVWRIWSFYWFQTSLHYGIYRTIFAIDFTYFCIHNLLYKIWKIHRKICKYKYSNPHKYFPILLPKLPPLQTITFPSSSTQTNRLHQTPLATTRSIRITRVSIRIIFFLFISS